MDPRLQEMLDHYEITKTLNQYNRSCDRCDEVTCADVYIEDSWDEHGLFKDKGKAFAAAIVPHILESSETMYHLSGQTVITVNGDEAGAETYFLAGSRVKDEDGKTWVNQLGGRFADNLVKVDGVWKIKKRIVLRDWTISLPLDKDWEQATTLQDGERAQSDASYAALRQVHLGKAIFATA